MESCGPDALPLSLEGREKRHHSPSARASSRPSSNRSLLVVGATLAASTWSSSAGAASPAAHLWQESSQYPRMKASSHFPHPACWAQVKSE